VRQIWGGKKLFQGPLHSEVNIIDMMHAPSRAHQKLPSINKYEGEKYSVGKIQVGVEGGDKMEEEKHNNTHKIKRALNPKVEKDVSVAGC